MILLPRPDVKVDIFPYALRVAGVTHHLKDNARLVSDEIWAERITNNPHDEHAVGIWNVNANGPHVFVGYLPREVAAQVRDDQLPTKGEIVWKATEGVGIRIRL